MKHEILQGPEGTISGLLPSGAKAKGLAMMVTVDDDGEKVFALANGYCDGFLTRSVRAEGTFGSTVEQQLFGLKVDNDNDEFQPETPFEAGHHGSLEHGDELVVEGSNYIVKTGTGGIYSHTAAETKLSFADGKFRQAQSGDRAQYLLKKVLTPETEGDLRIFVKKIQGDAIA